MFHPHFFFWGIFGVVIQSLAALFVPGGFVPIWTAYALRTSRGIHADEAWFWIGIQCFFWVGRDVAFWTWFIGGLWLLLCLFCSRAIILAQGRIVWFLWCFVALGMLSMICSWGSHLLSVQNMVFFGILLWWCIQPNPSSKNKRIVYAAV